jgi:Flp pilus assembly secretin CpaC
VLAFSPGLIVARADDKPVNIRIEMQVVAIPQEQAMPLVADMMDKKKVEAANTKIQDLLTKGVGKLIAWPIVTTQSGQRAVVENIDEFRYATEYDPPTVSFTQGVNTAEPVKVAPKADVTHLEAVPTGFETRNTGVTLEVEPALLPDGKTIKLDMVPEHVRLKGMKKITIEKPSNGGTISVEQPEFDTMKVTTRMSLKSGERVLVGVYRTEDPPNHMELFILKAEVVPVD